MPRDSLSKSALLTKIAELEHRFSAVNLEKNDLSNRLEILQQYTTQLETQLQQKTQELETYTQQIERLTTALTLDNNSCDLADLEQVGLQPNALGHLAQIMVQTLQSLKTNEQELAAAKAQLKALLNAVPGSISWFDAQGVYLGVNRYLADAWNLPQSEFVGKKIGFLKTNSEFSEFIQNFIDSPQDSIVQTIEITLQEQLRYYWIAARKYQQGQSIVSVGIDVTEHKQAQKALQASEDRLRNLIANIPGVIYRCRCDQNWTMELISENIAEITGYSATEFVENQSRSFASIIHPEDQQYVAQEVAIALSSQKSYTLEYRLVHANGQIRWVLERGRATFGTEKNAQQAVYLDGVIFDITDYKKAEDALRQSEATNRALIAAIPDLLIRVKKDGTYLDIAGRERIKIHSVKNFLPGSHVIDSLPSQLAEKRMKAIEKALATRTMQMYEQRILVNNQVQDEEVRIVVTGEDEVLVMVRDITDRKRTEEALRIAEENYRSIYENALEGIFQSTPEGKYLSVNPAMARICGYDSPQEMVATVTDIAIQTYVDPQMREEFKQLIETQGEVKGFVYRAYRKDGSMIWVEESTRAVKDRDGSLLYYEGIIQDISDRKRQEEALRRQLEELKVEIDQKKRQQEVEEITQSDYFQELQSAAEHFQRDDFWL